MQQREATELKILYKSLRKKIKPKRNSYKINSNFKKGRRELKKSYKKFSNFEMMHFTLNQSPNLNDDLRILNKRVYMGHSKNSRNDQNFPRFHNQNLMKICLPPLTTMLILNPKIVTVPKKFEKYFPLTNRLAHSSS